MISGDSKAKRFPLFKTHVPEIVIGILRRKMRGLIVKIWVAFAQRLPGV
jgi:hypothetical protein